ncbi:MAG: cyclic nucleotide-binding domain-containing protein [Candidatus Gracilibacteria bacterium]|nr:cyclic nucleotide-binding domain-containing protein [Candidatus Gracilibacteria bacterium]
MNILDGIELLNELDSTDKENLSLFCQYRTLEKGEVIFKEGEEAVAMYILKKGRIEIRKEINRKDVILGNVEAEEVLGEMALFGDDNKRMATAVALVECELITILSFSIKDLTKKYPILYKKIKDIINNRIISNKIIESTIK